MQTLATRVSLLLISVISGIVIARTLGASGRGAYAVASTVAAIGAQLTTLGLHASNTYYLARDRGLLPSLIGNSLGVCILIGGAIGLALIGISVVVGLDELLHGDLLWLAAIAIPIYAAFTLLQNLLLGLYETARFNRVELMVNIGSLIALLVLVVYGWQSPASVYGVSLLVSVAVMLGVLRWLVKKGGGVTFSASLFRNNFSFSMRAYFSTLLFLLVARVDVLLLAHFQGDEAAGHYAIAISLGDLLSMLAVVTGNILFPRLSGEKDSGLRWKIASRTAIVIAVVIISLGCASMPVAAPMLSFLYGEEFQVSSSAYILLIPGVICLSINVIFMNFYAAEGMPPVVVIAPLVALFLKLVLGMLLIPSGGIEGAAISASFAYVLVLLVSLGYLAGWRRRALVVAS
jgi:O-antigen/teichoic acid export membrane protein